MKKLILLAFCFCMSLIYLQCESDDVSYTLEELSAPTEVNASFDIAQDDSGMVSVTPSATGVTQFEVYFGDTQGEEATAIAPGETGTHTYAEGSYNVRIVAVGLTGLTSEYNQTITISFSAPQDLSFEVSQTALDVTVTPTAVNAMLFDVYFGENEDEEPVSIVAGESASYTYQEAGSYEIRVVARGAGAATVESTQLVEITGATDPVVLPITFDEPTVNYAFGTFNGTSFEVVENPQVSGANATASQVGAITNSGNSFEGVTVSLGTPVDFSGDDKTISIKVYAEQALPVLMKFEGGIADARQTEVVVEHGGTGWEELRFNYATDAIKSYIDGNQGGGEAFVPTGQYEVITLFIDGPGTSAGIFYIDDLMQSAGSTQQLPQLPISFESDMISYEIIGFGGPDFGEIPAQIVDNPDNSGSNTSATVMEITKVEGAQTYGGANISLAGAIDFSSGTVVHVNVWSPREGTPILFKIEDTSSPLNNDGNPTIFAEVQATTSVAMQWEELSFDLSAFADFNTANAYDRMAIFPDFGSMGAGENFYFDDIQLEGSDNDDEDDGDTGNTVPTNAAPTPEVVTSNVIAMFSDAYDEVAVDTWITEWSASNYGELEIEENATKSYSQLDFAGIEMLGNPIDASEMTHLHIDVWSADFESFGVKLVDLGTDASIGTGDDTEFQVDFTAPTQGEWISYEIPLSDFEALSSTAQLGQMILVGRPLASNTIYIDNVYFHN